MTIAMGINFSTYVLLAADTRTIHYDWGGRKIGYDDESVKIQKTSMGLITGAGSKILLDAVKSALAREEITHTDQIKETIRRERLKVERIYEHRASQTLILTLKSTGWLFSYVTIENEKPKLRLGMFHPSLGSDMALYCENHPAMISPHEATEEAADLIVDFLRKKVRPVTEFSSLQSSIQYHWEIIAMLIREIQPSFPSISSHCQIGAHTINGYFGISPILRKTDLSATLSLDRSQMTMDRSIR